MLKNIPLSRAVLYMVCLGFIPLVFMSLLFFSENNRIEEFSESLNTLRDQIFIKEKKQALNVAVRQHFRDADHFYIDKYLETITLLDPEIETLQKIANDKNFANDERIKKRIEFLTGPSNSILFSEGTVHTFPFFQETIETLIHPVEVNANDIKNILSRIEGVSIGKYSPGPNRPQLIIVDFRLDKKKITQKNEVYILDTKLVKREFL